MKIVTERDDWGASANHRSDAFAASRAIRSDIHLTAQGSTLDQNRAISPEDHAGIVDFVDPDS
jgi:hypothetical protein